MKQLEKISHIARTKQFVNQFFQITMCGFLTVKKSEEGGVVWTNPCWPLTIHSCLGTNPLQQRLFVLEAVEHADPGLWLLQ